MFMPISGSPSEGTVASAHNAYVCLVLLQAVPPLQVVMLWLYLILC